MIVGLFFLAAGLLGGEELSDSSGKRIESRWLSVAGIRVHYRQTRGVSRERLPVLFVHGWMGSSYDFVDLMQHLPDRFLAVAPDLPGCGRSQKSGFEFTPDYYIRFLGEFLSALGISQAVVVGHSMGGGLTVNFAVRQPESVQRLVLIAPDGLRGEEGFLEVVRSLGLLVDLGTGLNNRIAIEIALRLNVFHNLDYASREFIDSVAETSLSPGARRAQAKITKQVLGQSPVDDLLPSLKLPTLIIWGDHDRVLSPRWAGEYAKRIPGARLLMIPDSGHMPQIEAAKRVSGEISDFVTASTR